jgi:hypothetical protein
MGTAYSETGIRRCFDGCEQVVVHWVGGDGESTVNDSAVNVHPKVDLEDVVVL